MAIRNLFSKRQRRARGEFSDVYQYAELPDALRTQVSHILGDIPVPDIFREAQRILVREHALVKLPHDDGYSSSQYVVVNYFYQNDNLEKALDVLEICFQEFEKPRWGSYTNTRTNLIDELNARFQENAVGYKYESGQIMRIDSELLHNEVIRPVLTLLSEPGFEGANEEFLTAHEHYRHGRYDESLVHALRTFESVMKIIIGRNGWADASTMHARQLIRTCLDNGLIPTYFESQFNSLRSLLESGLPTVRNRTSGHGQGEEIRTVPAHLAQYGLNTAASNIMLLVNANKDLD